MIFELLLLAVFIFLFALECNKDKQTSVKKEVEGDLHMLREFKKFHDQHTLDAAKYDEGVRELEQKLK